MNDKVKKFRRDLEAALVAKGYVKGEDFYRGSVRTGEHMTLFVASPRMMGLLEDHLDCRSAASLLCYAA